MRFHVISIIHFSRPQFLLIIWSIDKTHQEQINNQTEPNGKTICQHKLKSETASSNGDEMKDFFHAVPLAVDLNTYSNEAEHKDKMMKMGYKMVHLFG